MNQDSTATPGPRPLVHVLLLALALVSLAAGLMLIFFGAIIGFGGVGPSGAVNNVAGKIHGVALVLIGLLYWSPVTLLKTRKSRSIYAGLIGGVSLGDTALMTMVAYWPSGLADYAAMVAYPFALAALPLIRVYLVSLRLKNIAQPASRP